MIPPARNQKEKRDYGQALHRLRRLAESGVLEFKQWRGVATRYAKRAASYLSICQLRAVMIWAQTLLTAPSSHQTTTIAATHHYKDFALLESAVKLVRHSGENRNPMLLDGLTLPCPAMAPGFRFSPE